MDIDSAALDMITDAVLRYRPPNKGLKTVQKIGKEPKKIDENKPKNNKILVDSEK